MKKILCIIGVVSILVAGSICVYADPWAEPTPDNSIIIEQSK